MSFLLSDIPNAHRTLRPFRYAVLLSFALWQVGCGNGRTTVPSSPVTDAQGVSKPSAVLELATSETASDSVLNDDWFEDVTNPSGLVWTHRNGREAGRFFMIESFGGGAGVIDYDLDGDCDLLITGGGTISRDHVPTIGGLPSALFRNQGDWQFENVSVAAGFSAPAAYSQGCAVADFDADGFPDLFVCGYPDSHLYHNCGDGTYREIAPWQSRSGGTASDRDWTTAAVFADFDHDGLSDLVVARYAHWSPETDVECSKNGVRDLCGPTSYDGTTCRAYHNSGDGLFEDCSDRAGLTGSVHGLAVVAADLNLDGWVDLYIASDVTPNQLYLGGPNLPMTEQGAIAGVAFNEWGQAEGSMGVDVADFDGDGQPDIWVTNFEREDNALYRNLENGLFLHSTAAAGLSGVSRMNVGFGTSMSDFDGDGWPDIFVLNGNPIYSVADSPFKQKPQLFRNTKGRFTDVSDKGGTFFREVHSGRGSAVADFDDDGALDIVAVPINDPVRILRNRIPPKNFVRVQLKGRHGEPDATGARISAEYQGRILTRFVVRGTGFFSQSDPRMIIPVATDMTNADIEVQWPARNRELFRGLQVRQSHVLIEGRGETVRD